MKFPLWGCSNHRGVLCVQIALASPICARYPWLCRSAVEIGRNPEIAILSLGILEPP